MLKFDLNFVFTLVNLVIFFILIRVFLFKPIQKVIDKRNEIINAQLENADNAQKQAEELKEQYQAQLEGVEEEKSRILIDARNSAKKEYENIVSRAETDAEKIKANAKKVSDAECEKARLAVKEEIAALAMETAIKVIGDSVSAKTDKEIYDKFLSESSENND